MWLALSFHGFELRLGFGQVHEVILYLAIQDVRSMLKVCKKGFTHWREFGW
jgi:hypothetical protein